MFEIKSYLKGLEKLISFSLCVMGSNIITNFQGTPQSNKGDITYFHASISSSQHFNTELEYLQFRYQ